MLTPQTLSWCSEQSQRRADAKFCIEVACSGPQGCWPCWVPFCVPFCCIGGCDWPCSALALRRTKLRDRYKLNGCLLEDYLSGCIVFWAFGGASPYTYQEARRRRLLHTRPRSSSCRYRTDRLRAACAARGGGRAGNGAGETARLRDPFHHHCGGWAELLYAVQDRPYRGSRRRAQRRRR